MSDAPPPIDAAFFDASTAASDDFYRYVNGGWLEANPVPSEYASWGAPQIVNARNQELLHRLLQDAASPNRASRLGRPDGGRLLRRCDG